MKWADACFDLPDQFRLMRQSRVLMTVECGTNLFLARAQLGSIPRFRPQEPRGIFLPTCVQFIQESVSREWLFLLRVERLENLFCLRCNRELEGRNKSVAVYMFAQTVGIRPRQKSTAQRICFCPQCSVSLAMGPPPEGALNIAAWNMIRDLVGADPALNQAAWESLRGVVGLLPATGTEGSSRRAAAAGAYFEF